MSERRIGGACLGSPRRIPSERRRSRAGRGLRDPDRRSASGRPSTKRRDAGPISRLPRAAVPWTTLRPTWCCPVSGGNGLEPTRPLPTKHDIQSLGREGFPVDDPGRLGGVVRRTLRQAAPLVVRLAWRQRSARHVGWITPDSFPDRKSRFRQLDSFSFMRAGQLGEWLNENVGGVRHEIYRSGRSYDVVVFQKMMDERCQQEAADVRRRGGKVVFDANVNYYESWGDYFVPGTRRPLSSGGTRSR